MATIDRLSSLMQHLEISCSVGSLEEACNFWILGKNGEPLTLLFHPVTQTRHILPDTECMASAKIDIAGTANPIIFAFPEKVVITLSTKPELKHIAELLINEYETPRCGSDSVFSKLGELLVIHLFRYAIENNETRPGVLAGLANPNLSAVIVAIHENPQKSWTIDDFTQIAGMSRSSFMAEFANVMGETPMNYLKNWRLSMAHSALTRGARVSETARRVGYSGPEAFSRAFSKSFGISPREFRQIAQETLPPNPH